MDCTKQSFTFQTINMKKILLPVVLLAILFASCKKKDGSVSTTNTNNFKTYTSMDEVFALLALQPKVMTFDAQAGASFYGNSGTRYVFKKNSFIYANGDTVTGNVQIEVTEYITKGDMIFSGALPISNGQPLISGGEINVTGSRSGKEIFLRSGFLLQANIPQFGSTDTSLDLYHGYVPANATKDNNVNWLKKNIDSFAYGGIYYHGDTISILSDSLGWGNPDKLPVKPEYQDVKVSVVITGGGTDVSSMRCYALWDTHKFVNQLNYADNLFPGKVPGFAVHFVAFGLVNGHFYGGVTAATPKTGENYKMTLTEVDPKDFKAQLALYP
ncbi:MAG: hypothetical protein JWQ38_247 [Flavipsychrobacter sp.]|nr:hypothetical protein [Flavipsychrobacter sp.]